MKKLLITIYLLCISVITDAAEVTEVSELELKKDKFTNLLAQAGNASIRSNWRRLSVGMSKAQVRALLGEPIYVQGGSFEYWCYFQKMSCSTARGGQVSFYRGVVDGWKEPN